MAVPTRGVGEGDGGVGRVVAAVAGSGGGGRLLVGGRWFGDGKDGVEPTLSWTEVDNVKAVVDWLSGEQLATEDPCLGTYHRERLGGALESLARGELCPLS